MKYELNTTDIRIILKALRQRAEDLSRFADDCRSKNMRAAENEFLEMSNRCLEVIEKLEPKGD